MELTPAQTHELQVKTMAFRTLLKAESDRGCALMAGSYLDEQLKLLLVQFFIDDRGVEKNLLDYPQPLSSFSARINVAYYLGLIAPKVRQDLHQIRDIRNKFGHSTDLIDFSHEEVAPRCAQLYYTCYDSKTAPRVRFVNSVLTLLAVIHARMFLQKHQPADTDSDYTDDTRQRIFEETQALSLKVLSEIGFPTAENAAMILAAFEKHLYTTEASKKDSKKASRKKRSD